MLPGPLSQSTVLYRFTNNPLQPAIHQDRALWVTTAINIQPGVYLAAGTVLGQVTAASTPDVQMITISGGSGSMQFSLLTPFGVVGPFLYNASTATIQAGLQAFYGSGNLLVTGTPGSSYVVTGANQLVAGPLALMAQVNVSSGLTVSVAHTTIGIKNGVFNAYSGALIAAPTAVPVLSDGATGTWPAGSYEGSYTYANAAGETTSSPVTAYASTGTKRIHFGALSSIPAGVTKVNFYINGMFAIQKTVASSAVAAFDVDLADVASTIPLHMPNANTAYVATDGTSAPVGLLETDTYSDTFGNLTMGQGSGIQTPIQSQTANMVIKGFVRAEALSGLDANAVAKLGRLIFGTPTNGLLSVN